MPDHFGPRLVAQQVRAMRRRGVLALRCESGNPSAHRSKHRWRSMHAHALRRALSGLNRCFGQSDGQMRFPDPGGPNRITLEASCTNRNVRNSRICRSSIDG